MIGFLFAIISTFGYSLNQIFNKKLILNKLSDIEAILISNFFIFLFSTILMMFNLKELRIINDGLIIFIFSSLLLFIGTLFLFKSFKYLKVGETMSIANTFPFIILILDFLILNKKIPLSKILIMFLVFFGIYLIIKKEKFKLKIYYIFPIITAISWGVFNFTIYFLIVKKLNIFLILFYLELFLIVFSFIYYLIFYKKEIKKNKKIKEEKRKEKIEKVSKKTKNKLIEIFHSIKRIFTKNNIILGSLVGITTIIGTLFYGLSTKYIPSSIAASITSSQVAFTFIFSYFILKEKITKKQIIGIMIVVISLILFNKL